MSVVMMVSGLLDVDMAQLGMQAGGAGIIGFVTGFAAKKVMKVIAVLFGAQVAFLAYLENQGIVSVDWTKLEGFASDASANAGAMRNIVDTVLATIPLGGGFAIGLAAGFKSA